MLLIFLTLKNAFMITIKRALRVKIRILIKKNENIRKIIIMIRKF